ncbi:hypothetical protein BG003_001445, partial [Podila horticola]
MFKKACLVGLLVATLSTVNAAFSHTIDIFDNDGSGSYWAKATLKIDGKDICSNE